MQLDVTPSPHASQTATVASAITSAQAYGGVVAFYAYQSSSTYVSFSQSLFQGNYASSFSEQARVCSG